MLYIYKRENALAPIKSKKYLKGQIVINNKRVEFKRGQILTLHFGLTVRHDYGNHIHVEVHEKYSNTLQVIDSHISNTDNPHELFNVRIRCSSNSDLVLDVYEPVLEILEVNSLDPKYELVNPPMIVPVPEPEVSVPKVQTVVDELANQLESASMAAEDKAPSTEEVAEEVEQATEDVVEEQSDEAAPTDDSKPVAKRRGRKKAVA